MAAFLRSRRNRLDPTSAGVRHTYGRRRTPGLRREELSALAGVSVTWYTWLEQGRRIRVSRQVLASIADALRLDHTETAHLFRLAGELPPASDRARRPDRVSPQYLMLLEHLDPLPALIVNSRLDILAWNQGFCALFPPFESLPEEQRNSLLLTFHPELREYFPNWETKAARMVAMFRTHAADRLVQPEFTELVDGLRRASPEFRAFWEQRELVPSIPSAATITHPILGPLELTQVKMEVADTHDTLMVYQFPPGTPLADRFAELVAQRARDEQPLLVSGVQ
ncbi:helix-turn-helix transcriptional regulator [Krasilnikovia sp. MM14-A1259]|uniref:helix-turn-helix transcriptional regulator n=1 Tax=Krasilnikovia sp. MM14-A1259 TaxID=3373539 RepID=UPI00382A4677